MEHVETEQKSETHLAAKDDPKSGFSFVTAKFIEDLIDEKFINFNPQRDIFNVTFTFPKEAKADVHDYIKRNGKKDLVNMILGEVQKCRNVEVR